MTVPIVPGPSEPFTLSSVMPAEPPRRPRWLAPLIVGLLVLALAGAGYVAWGLTHRAAPAGAGTAASSAAASTPIRDAYFGCGQIGQVSDQDRTIVLDTKGNALSKATVSDVNCVLQHLGAPDYILETMKKTRAIDGRQHDQWRTFEASWTYHPDQGLDVIIHDTSA